MHKNEVIDLQFYRDADSEGPEDESSQSLPAGTMLLHGQYTITGYLNCAAALE